MWNRKCKVEGSCCGAATKWLIVHGVKSRNVATIVGEHLKHSEESVPHFKCPFNTVFRLMFQAICRHVEQKLFGSGQLMDTGYSFIKLFSNQVKSRLRFSVYAHLNGIWVVAGRVKSAFWTNNSSFKICLFQNFIIPPKLNNCAWLTSHCLRGFINFRLGWANCQALKVLCTVQRVKCRWLWIPFLVHLFPICLESGALS